MAVNKVVVIVGVLVVIIAVAVAVMLYYRPPAPSQTTSPSPTQSTVQTSPTTSTVTKKVLRVGTSPDFPPFEYINETTGEIVGIDIDLVRAIAKRLGYEVEIVSIEFSGLIPALQAGQIDLIASGMTITEERAKVVDFSIPYWEADQAILVKAGSSFKPKGLEDLSGKRVGVQTGTTAEILVMDYVNATGVKIDLKSYPTYTLATKDLVNDNLDAVIVDSPVAKTLAKLYNVEISSTIQTGEKYGLAVKKGNTELLSAINQVLNEILNSPEWENIVEKYLG
mgnify:CR=1 FL=1